ncbi:MAG TPA: tetratricopeptide repeat protein [Chthoniobacter sp.]
MSPEAAYQQALFHRQAGRLAEAEPLLREVVAARPDHAKAWHQLGLVVLALGRPGEAVECIGRAIALNPSDAYPYSDQGVAYAHLGRGEEAVACYERALRLAPELAYAHRNLADTLFSLGRQDEAIASYQRALALMPNDAATHNNLGNVYLRQNRLPEAGACYERATQLDPRLLVAQSNLGDILTKLGRPDAGFTCAQRALALDPNFADGYLNLGAACWQMGRFADAEACSRRAIAMRPDFVDAHVNLGILLLLNGRYEEGWREYSWTWHAQSRAARPRKTLAETWDGNPAPGKTILTYADQGAGDTIHFLRYVPLLAARANAARILIECQPPLLPLLRQWRSAAVEIVATGEADKLSEPHDLQIPLLRLPLALGHYPPLPMSAPYLEADAERRALWRARLDRAPALRVGLAWAGNPSHTDDRRRSMPVEALVPLLSVPGVSFVSLQVSPHSQLPTVIAATGIHDFVADIQDFADTAALVAELDLIITVDTATAHVAGALGRPVWVMLAFIADWRWGLEREDTPWYPTMRLFRQGRAGDWAGVVERIAGALRRLSPERSAAAENERV